MQLFKLCIKKIVAIKENIRNEMSWDFENLNVPIRIHIDAQTPKSLYVWFLFALFNRTLS